MFEHFRPSSETCCTALGCCLVNVLDFLCCVVLCAFVKCKGLGSQQAMSAVQMQWHLLLEQLGSGCDSCAHLNMGLTCIRSCRV